MVKIQNPSFEILRIDTEALALIECAGRTCYKSEEKIAPGSAKKFTEMILGRGHESVIEHASATVRFVHNRGFTHELVRHRIASFSQESTRFCNYATGKFGGQITVIAPYWTDFFDEFSGIPKGDGDVDIETKFRNRETVEDLLIPEGFWWRTICSIEDTYVRMTKTTEGHSPLKHLLPPEAARGILPNDLKTQIGMTANLREWRHIFRLRTSDAAHPDMIRVMKPLLEEFRKRVPVIFDNIGA